MNLLKPVGYYESLIIQIESDFENLKKTFEKLKTNSTNKKLILELCENYSFLLQDVKYFEKLKENVSGLERPISLKLLKILNEMKVLLKKVRNFLMNQNQPENFPYFNRAIFLA